MTTQVLPDLTLPAHTGEDVHVSSRAGSGGTLLVFIPYAFTAVCASELEQVVHLAPSLRAQSVDTIVVSCDSKYALRAWAEAELGHRWDSVPLLSDFWPHGELARACGVFDERRGGPHRTALLADAAGSVIDVESAEFGQERDLTRFVR